MSNIPVFVKYPDAKSPDGKLLYIVARNGLHLRVENDWLDAVIPVKEFQALEVEEPRASVKLPPIDARTFAEIVEFFRVVLEHRGTEAVVLLHYATELGWTFTVPEQRVSKLQIHHYDMTQRVSGYRCVGTAHSHGSIPAGHSFVDMMDESLFDGVHITVGSLLQKPYFSLDAMVFCRGHPFKLLPTMIAGLVQPRWKPRQALSRSHWLRMENLAMLVGWSVPDEWLAQIIMVEDTFQLSLPDKDDGSSEVGFFDRIWPEPGKFSVGRSMYEKWEKPK